MDQSISIKTVAPTSTEFLTFLGIGVLKAGTSLIHRWLSEHPQVCVPADRKECNFFDRHYSRGLEWYRGLFMPSNHAAIGEFSVSYICSEQALSRIAVTFPNVRCLLSLRDPVSRFESHYRYYSALTGYSGSYSDFAAQTGAVTRGFYAPQLERLFTFISRERIKVFIFEEMINNPAEACRDLFTFIGVDSSFPPPSLNTRIGETKAVRLSRVYRAAKTISRHAHATDQRWLLRIGKHMPLHLFTAPASFDQPRRLTAMESQVLRQIYARDIDRTSAILDIDLSKFWGQQTTR